MALQTLKPLHEEDEHQQHTTPYVYFIILRIESYRKFSKRSGTMYHQNFLHFRIDGNNERLLRNPLSTPTNAQFGKKRSREGACIGPKKMSACPTECPPAGGCLELGRPPRCRADRLILTQQDPSKTLRGDGPNFRSSEPRH